ncbi:DPH4 homolog [Nematostella vectensis]|uniref:DPH4 homolog n=1 Tax=Nematostella vectensis TaxID=45351 RepID=UPI0020779637|nr:DPH4 homolog [Nematostella vectensis]
MSALRLFCFLSMNTESERNYYDVLGVDSSSSSEEIRKAYQRLALKFHPDKLDAAQTEKSQAVKEFHAISEAWNVLSNSELKSKYDKGITEINLQQKWPVNGSVDLDDMEENDDGSYSSPCRCGGEYVITNAHLQSGQSMVCCTTCTLSIRVLYAVVSEEEDS